MFVTVWLIYSYYEVLVKYIALGGGNFSLLIMAEPLYDAVLLLLLLLLLLYRTLYT